MPPDATTPNGSTRTTASDSSPVDDAVDGYPGKLMPADYGRRLSETDIDALAAFIAAAAGTEEDDEGGNSGRGRGGRGSEDSGRG